MLKTFILSDFIPLIGNSFQLQDQPERALQLELIEAVKLSNLSTHSSSRPESFSLLFKGPDDLALVQNTYCLHHTQLGELSIFGACGPTSRRNML